MVSSRGWFALAVAGLLGLFFAGLQSGAFGQAPGLSEASGDDKVLAKVAVNGTVTRSDGSPAVGADVWAGGAGYQAERFQATAKCDAAGRFELQITADMCYLFVAALGDDVSASKTIVVRADRPAAAVALELAPAAFVLGTVKRGKTANLVADQVVSLALVDTDGHAKLPEAERLPNPTGATKAIMPRVVRQTQTNKQGEYGFAVGTGRYAMTATDLVNGPEFAIKATSVRGRAQRQQVNLSIGPDREKFSGRVVLKSKPDQGVADAVVWGIPFAADGEIFPVRSDADGRFATQLWISSFSIGGSIGGAMRNAPPGPGRSTSTFLFAMSGDGLLAGITEIDADKLEAVISIEPTASVRGRVVTPTRATLAGSQINYGVKVHHGRGQSLIFGGFAISNAKGEFTINGLVPGWTYAIDETMRFNGWMPSMFHQVGTAAPVKAETLSVGDLVVEATDANGPLGPPTLDWMIYREIVGRNTRYPLVDERFPHKMRDAKISGRPILLMLTPGRKDVCEQFFTMLYDPEQTRKYAAVQEDVAKFVLVAIDTSEKRYGLDLITPLLTRLKLPVANDGGGTFAILDSNAELLVTKTAPDLSVAGKLDAEKLRELLRVASAKP